jgi:hypothetical protein
VTGQSYWETLVAAQAAGDPVANTVTATSLLTNAAAHAKKMLYADFFSVPGKQLLIRATGRISTVVTTPGTLTLDVRFGSTKVFDGAAMNLSTTAHTNVPWWLDIELTCRAVGASATVLGLLRFVSQAGSATAVADSTTSHGTLLAPNSAPAVGNTFDSTATQIVDLFATWSVANASNTLRVEQYRLVSPN